jgi:sugar-specific transcriptional regulator TrmB
MLHQILPHIGLNEKETEIFMQTAKLGGAPASRIAQKTSIKRTTCYQILEQLCERKIMQRHIHAKTRYYTSATIPELLDIFEKQIENLNSAHTQLQENQKHLEKMYNKTIGETEIIFYEGWDDIKNIYDQILNEKDKDIYSIMKKQDTKDHPLSSYWKQYLARRIKAKKHSYSLVPKTDDTNIYVTSSYREKRDTLTVPPKDIAIFGDIKVSGKSTAIISQHEGRIFGILIKDEKIAKMFKDILRALWKQYSK